jgi:two-component system, cell cycle sensor histidine kinase and response regulator CckA
MAHPASTATPRGTETILMVQPDPETRALAVFMLSRLGYRVLEARNAMEAVKVYAEWPEEIDLLFTETLMSRVNGHELAQMLTRDHPELRVLFLADVGYQRLTRDVAQRKGLHFLRRPFTMRLLAAKVREVLDVPMTKALGASF